MELLAGAQGSVLGGGHNSWGTLQWSGGIIGFECSRGEGAVFCRDGRDADGRCKQYLGGKSMGTVLE